jgi:hypothetical protein
MREGDRSDRPATEKAGQIVPAAEALSFLKEIKGAATWTDRDLTKSLEIGAPEAKQVLAILDLQGYIEPAGKTNEWRTTEQGDLVSRAKTPRFTREAIEQSLSALRDGIQEINRDTNVPCEVVDAVAFGDFLTDKPRFQAPDVGIWLASRKCGASEAGAVRERAAEEAFFKRLRGKITSLHIRPYEEWMSVRSHRKLL